MLFALLYMQILLQCRYIKKLSTISIQVNSAMEFSARNVHISDLLMLLVLYHAHQYNTAADQGGIRPNVKREVIRYENFGVIIPV